MRLTPSYMTFTQILTCRDRSLDSPVPSSDPEMRNELSGLKEVLYTGPLCPDSRRTSELKLNITHKGRESGSFPSVDLNA